MNRTQPRPDQLLVCVTIAAVFVGWASGDETREIRPSLSRWAIVATGDDAQTRGIADLLTAELSSQPDIHLVERDRIRAVLSEWKLNASGLVARERQVELGRIIAADVVLLVEEAKLAQPPSLHVSSVETRTGLQLSSVFVRAKAVDELESVASETIHAILKQSRLSEADRLYVAVAGVHSDEPGQALTPTAQALAACLVHDLQRVPGIFVLERRRLQQLTAERDLTGIDLVLRSSTILVEAGLGRDEHGAGNRVNIRLTSSSGQTLKRGTLQTETVDFQAVRRALSEQVVVLLGGASPAKELADRTVEGQHFAALAWWLYSNNRFDEAVDAAESAFALDPTAEHCTFLNRVHDKQVDIAMQDRNSRGGGTIEARLKQARDATYRALVEARRCHELDLFWISRPSLRQPSNPPVPTIEAYSIGMSGNPFNPHIPRLHARYRSQDPPLEPESQELQSLRKEYDSLRLEKYQLLTSLAKDSPRKLAGLAVDELLKTDYFAADEADYVRRVLEIQKNIDRQVKVLKSQGGGRVVHFDGRVVRDADMIRRENARNLAEQLRWVSQKYNSDIDEHPSWSADELIPLWTALMNHAEPKIAVLGCLALSAVETHRDAAIRRGLEVLPEVDRDGVELCAQIRKHLGRTDELETILEGVIARAEAAKAPAELTHRRDLIVALCGAIGEDRGNWRTRMDALLSEGVPPTSSVAHDGAALRELLDRQFRQMHPSPNTTLGFELSGAWSEYEVKILEPQHPSWNRGFWPNISASNSRETDDPLAYIFESDQKILVGKIRLTGGKVDEIARTSFVREGQAFGRPITVASDSDVLYIMTGEPGMARVDLKTKQVWEWGAADGFIGGRINTMALHRSKVYMGMDGGVSEFDPATQKFRLLASSSALEQRSSLDSRSNKYFVTEIVSDPGADRLWMHIAAGSRSGIWRYSPAEGTFERQIDLTKPAAYSTSNMTWFHDDLFFLSTHGWQLLDTKTGVAAVLGGYANYGHSFPTNPKFLRVGDHIVQGCGRIYTPDGKVHQLGLPEPWSTVLPTSRGFIALRNWSKKNQLLVFTRDETKLKE